MNRREGHCGCSLDADMLKRSRLFRRSGSVSSSKRAIEIDRWVRGACSGTSCLFAAVEPNTIASSGADCSHDDLHKSVIYEYPMTTRTIMLAVITRRQGVPMLLSDSLFRGRQPLNFELSAMTTLKQKSQTGHMNFENKGMSWVFGLF